MEELFETASARPAPERAAFLDAECTGDGVMRNEVEALLVGAVELLPISTDVVNGPPMIINLAVIAAWLGTRIWRSSDCVS